MIIRKLTKPAKPNDWCILMLDSTRLLAGDNMGFRSISPASTRMPS